VCEVDPIPVLRGKYDTWKADHIADADSCFASIDKDALVSNGSSTATISMSIRNDEGEPLTKGLVFDIASDRGGTVGPVINNGDGNYSAEVTAPTEPGDETFTITVECVGEPVVLNEQLSLMYVKCGDADASSGVDIDDVVYLIAYIFTGGPGPIPYEAADADCSGGVDIDDVVYLIAYIFSGGPPPCDGCN
jgi:hypothetical protein